MQQRIECLALRSVKYGDSRVIATVWCRQRGRIAVSVPSGKGQTATRMRALLMPLGVFEAQAAFRSGQEVTPVSCCAMLLPSPASIGDPAKSVITMFLADFLYIVLKESGPDPVLTDFLFASVQELSEASGSALANFTLLFLYRLGRFLGIEPDTSLPQSLQQQDSVLYFDMREGRFTRTLPLHGLFLHGQEARLVKVFSRLTPRSVGLLRLNRAQRGAILDRMLQYYSLHYCPLTSLTSLPIVRDLFS